MLSGGGGGGNLMTNSFGGLDDDEEEEEETQIELEVVYTLPYFDAWSSLVTDMVSSEEKRASRDTGGISDVDDAILEAFVAQIGLSHDVLSMLRNLGAKKLGDLKFVDERDLRDLRQRDKTVLLRAIDAYHGPHPLRA